MRVAEDGVDLLGARRRPTRSRAGWPPSSGCSRPPPGGRGRGSPRRRRSRRCPRRGDRGEDRLRVEEPDQRPVDQGGAGHVRRVDLLGRLRAGRRRRRSRPRPGRPGGRRARRRRSAADLPRRGRAPSRGTCTGITCPRRLRTPRTSAGEPGTGVRSPSSATSRTRSTGRAYCSLAPMPNPDLDPAHVSSRPPRRQGDSDSSRPPSRSPISPLTVCAASARWRPSAASCSAAVLI